MQGVDRYVQTPLAISVKSALAHVLFHPRCLGFKLQGETAYPRCLCSASEKAVVSRAQAMNRRIGTEPNSRTNTRFSTVALRPEKDIEAKAQSLLAGRKMQTRVLVKALKLWVGDSHNVSEPSGFDPTQL